ncbi:hypothetical protein pipiens_013380 [Culex pipiens pipiens]|uniref:Uncharacterized protein n=2 Tax=Culex pipiens pipiens TaxID=38569 RepID=A0ABD1CYN3_CULPP
MVCVPCFIIPVLLYLWHKFIQPIVLRYWNPWEKKDKDGNVIKAGPEFPFQCKGGVCPFPGKSNKDQQEGEPQWEEVKPGRQTAERVRMPLFGKSQKSPQELVKALKEAVNSLERGDKKAEKAQEDVSKNLLLDNPGHAFFLSFIERADNGSGQIMLLWRT